MSKIVIGYTVNDEKAFNEAIFKTACDSMTECKGDAPFYAYAISHHDEFDRMEKIEDILENEEGLSSSEMIEAIQSVVRS